MKVVLANLANEATSISYIEVENRSPLLWISFGKMWNLSRGDWLKAYVVVENWVSPVYDCWLPHIEFVCPCSCIFIFLIK